MVFFKARAIAPRHHPLRALPWPSGAPSPRFRMMDGIYEETVRGKEKERGKEGLNRGREMREGKPQRID